jgi:hypothetical protein
VLTRTKEEDKTQIVSRSSVSKKGTLDKFVVIESQIKNQTPFTHVDSRLIIKI